MMECHALDKQLREVSAFALFEIRNSNLKPRYNRDRWQTYLGTRDELKCGPQEEVSHIEATVNSSLYGSPHVLMLSRVLKTNRKHASRRIPLIFCWSPIRQIAIETYSDSQECIYNREIKKNT